MDGLVIRPATPDDADALRAIYAPYVTETAVTFECEVPSREEFAQRIAHTLERYPYLVAVMDGTVIGYAYAGAFKSRAAYDWCCETSIYLAPDKRHRGFGSALYDALEEELVSMGLLNLYACVAHPNQEDEHLTLDSVLFHERRGFKIVGRFNRCGHKFGTWYDMVWMEKVVGKHQGCQPPVRWHATVQSDRQ